MISSTARTLPATLASIPSCSESWMYPATRIIKASHDIILGDTIGGPAAFYVFYALPELLKKLANGITANDWLQLACKVLCQSLAMPYADQVCTTRFRTQVMIAAPSIKRVPVKPIVSIRRADNRAQSLSRPRCPARGACRTLRFAGLRGLKNNAALLPESHVCRHPWVCARRRLTRSGGIPAAIPLLASAITYTATSSYVNISVRGSWAGWECMVTE